MHIGTIEFSDLPITLGLHEIASCEGRACIDEGGSVTEIEFAALREGKWTTVHKFVPMGSRRPDGFDDLMVKVLAQDLEIAYRDQINDLIAENSKPARDPGPSQEQRL